MDITTIKCDVCGQHKLETNHWLVAGTRPAAEFKEIVFLPAESRRAPRFGEWQYDDLCGEGCAHKRLSRWLTDLKANSNTTK